MITNAQQAWVIHRYWSGDTSARVSFFTKEFGLINCLYKGGRTPQKQAELQTFTSLWLNLDIRNDTYFYLRKIESAESPIQLAGASLFAGLYINELLYYMLQPLDAHAFLHGVYAETLKGLSNAANQMSLEVVLRRFERELLSACGYHIPLHFEANSSRPIDSDTFYQFTPGEGFVPVAEGIIGKHILALANDSLDDSAMLKSAKHIMRIAIDHALDGKEIKTRVLYRVN